jgi:hypothetical protein
MGSALRIVVPMAAKQRPHAIGSGFRAVGSSEQEPDKPRRCGDAPVKPPVGSQVFHHGQGLRQAAAAVRPMLPRPVLQPFARTTRQLPFRSSAAVEYQYAPKACTGAEEEMDTERILEPTGNACSAQVG